MGNEADIQAVLDRRHDNGADFWATVDGRLGVGRPFSTIESIVILHELGLGAGHEAVGGALDLLLGAWRDDGRFHVAPSGAIYPCHTANIARTLCRFGLAGDDRLTSTLAHLLAIQHDDGGWRITVRPSHVSSRRWWRDPSLAGERARKEAGERSGCSAGCGATVLAGG
jgi:hypothetical protein